MVRESGGVSHQEEWNSRWEEYCQAREEGILALSRLGDTEMEVRSSDIIVILLFLNLQL